LTPGTDDVVAAGVAGVDTGDDVLAKPAPDGALAQPVSNAPSATTPTAIGVAALGVRAPDRVTV
jgi:hypothetical protein